MDVEITISGTEDARGELIALRQWLIREDEYRGRVDFASAQPEDGELGGFQELLLAAIAAGGLDALGRTIGVWLQTRRSDITVSLRADGTVEEVSASGPAARIVAERLFGDAGPKPIAKDE
ncbi:MULTISPECIES: effector-associated constant component EACC1 [Glycomyces]|uniref:Uncharacterized protein n=2 Tax=Glycomyces TaxID=58113 RepID=A0A9X3TAH1_9ACTN|nr:hypothetical protein [Glycomyces lechevalierae]MDA1387733.1 hypothetical protein [Glycomyces lechevalierae]MDR7337364.1 hypothetical protein [Glycomyces lechevalierae]